MHGKQLDTVHGLQEVRLSRPASETDTGRAGSRLLEPLCRFFTHTPNELFSETTRLNTRRSGVVNLGSALK